jgi:hypothetical protein
MLLSVGALALSVVAMTTMFIFVYSHGGRALEAPLAQHSEPSASAAPLASIAQPEPGAPSPRLLAAGSPQCAATGQPLAPAALRDTRTSQRGPEIEIRALHATGSGPRGFAGGALDEALPCE